MGIRLEPLGRNDQRGSGEVHQGCRWDPWIAGRSVMVAEQRCQEPFLLSCRRGSAGRAAGLAPPGGSVITGSAGEIALREHTQAQELLVVLLQVSEIVGEVLPRHRYSGPVRKSIEGIVSIMQKRSFLTVPMFVAS